MSPTEVRRLGAADSSSSGEGAAWRRAGDLFLEGRLERAGVAHGVTTRALGDMRDHSRRLTLFERFVARPAGAGGEAGVCLKQVHGDRVVRFPADFDGKDEAARPQEAGSSQAQPVLLSPETVRPEADGVMAASPCRPLCVYTADCVPLLLWGPGAAFGGVFHVGWRGAALGFAGTAVRALCREFSARPGEISAAVGPHIGPCCYRVGPEVASRFGAGSLAGGAGDLRLDLGREIASQLADAGVPAAAVSACGRCTSCDGGVFFSYRKEGARESLLTFLALGS
ncbi:MAG: polyphenol oxidase family protein [Elusimicrobia bacterium]|nr:polyphenol oxidase family protein [Elusimicrobiota bacterium]